MKILMIGNHSSVKGGITSVISQINAFDWKEKNIELKFLASYIQTNKVHMLLYFIISCVKLVYNFIVFKPDIVHIHMSYKGSFERKYIMHVLCKKFGKSVIIHLHGSEFKKWYESVSDKKKEKIRTFLREVSGMIVLGEAWEKNIKEIEPKTNILVLHNSVSIPNEIVQWSNKTFQILFLGVLIERKGVHDLFRAIHKIKEDALMHNAKFLITGTGNQERELKKLYEDLELQELVHFYGWVSGNEKEKLIRNSQALVLPSYNEGLPIAILEGISYGLPIIATNVGDISAAVIDDWNGYIVNTKDIDNLANSITKMYNDRKNWERMRNNSRSIAIDKFSQLEYFSALEKIYLNAKE